MTDGIKISWMSDARQPHSDTGILHTVMMLGDKRLLQLEQNELFLDGFV